MTHETKYCLLNTGTRCAIKDRYTLDALIWVQSVQLLSHSILGSR